MREDYNRILLSTKSLLSDRLIIRKFKNADYLDVFEYGSDEQTVKYLVWEQLKTHDQAKNTISNYYLSRPGLFAIALKDPQKCIGCISILLDVANEKASIGYVLNRACWNRGYMTEALSAILSYCFERLELNRAESTYYVGNEASGRVMEKCGMIREGMGITEVKIKGIFHDVVHYAVTKNQWIAKQNQNI